MPHTQSRWIRWAAAVVAVGIVMTACGSSDDQATPGDDVADSVIAAVEDAVGTAAPPTTLREGCRIVQTEDEYGFPVDIEVCDDEPTTTVPEGGSVAFVDWAGGQDAEALAALLRDALVISGGCADAGLQRQLEVAVAAAPEDVRAPLERAAAELARASVYCQTDAARWAEHMKQAIAAVEEFVRVADSARVAAREEPDDE